MILLLFLYDLLYASSHDLESDYPWSGLKDDNSPTPELISFKIVCTCFRDHLTCMDFQRLPPQAI
jgi:hypothetical protein